MSNVKFKILKGGKVVATGALVAGGMAAGGAFAQTTGTDFSSILTGLSGASAITAILGAAVILAAVGFAKWGSKKVGKFFG
jgi:hypothetical protein